MSKLGYQWAAIRFMPNQVRGEFVNVGVVLQVEGQPQPMWQFAENSEVLPRIQFLDPDFDPEKWDLFKAYIVAQTLPNNPSAKGKTLLEYIHQEHTALFCLGFVGGGISDNPLRQIDWLFNQMVKMEEETL
jgi:hypothetical protein